MASAILKQLVFAFAPASLIEKSQFFVLKTLGRMAFSAGLLSISIILGDCSCAKPITLRIGFPYNNLNIKRGVVKLKLCVLGFGYIGLPTAIMFAKHGVLVQGVDTNPSVVNALKNRKLHINEPGLKSYLIEVLDSGNFSVSTQPVEADAYIISVPTPISPHKTANLEYVRNAAHMILPYLTQKNGTGHRIGIICIPFSGTSPTRKYNQRACHE